jgi:predicted GNAT family acetyltransferase
MQHPLDNPIWSALKGPNAAFAVGQGDALHFQRDVTPFSAISEHSDAAYADLAVHLPSGEMARMFRPSMEPLPIGWEHIQDFPLLQMVATQPYVPAQLAVEIRTLSDADLPQAMALVAQTEPGPFGERTMQLGRYVGVYESGILIAMAGERMRVPGYVELSAICTAHEARGRGLAVALVQHLMKIAAENGEVPFLHVVESNLSAIALYKKLGFSLRKMLHVLRRKPIR